MVRIEPDPYIRTYLLQFEAWAKRHCAPLHWQDAIGRQHNGTMTFLETPQRVLGITNAHVADQIADMWPVIKLTLGSAPFDASDDREKPRSRPRNL